MNHDNPRSRDIVIAPDPKNDEHFVLSPKPILRTTLTHFEPKQNQPGISTNRFTGRQVGSYYYVEVGTFWNHALFTKHSDTTTKFLGKAIPFDSLVFSEKQPTDFFEILTEIELIHTMFLGSVYMINP